MQNRLLKWLIFSLVFSVGWSARAQAPAAISEIDPCAGANSTPAFKTSFGGDDPIENILGINRKERVSILCQLTEALDDEYAGFELKQKELSLDLKSHLRDCINDENQIEDNSRGRFLERAKRCLGSFQDGHLHTSSVIESPMITLPIRTYWATDGVYIAAVQPSLIKFYGSGKISDADLGRLHVGARVVEIDGHPIAELLHNMEGLMNASSPAAKRWIAAQSLSYRDFMYPKSAFASVKIEVTTREFITYRLPWLALPNQGMPEIVDSLFKRGIPTLNLKDTLRDEKSRVDPDFFARPYHPEMPFESDAVVFRHHGDAVARMGRTILDRAHVFCYLDVRRSIDDVIDDMGSLKMLDYVRLLLRDCDAKGLPLVLDLRHNLGGALNFPAELFALIGNPHVPPPLTFLSPHTSRPNLATLLSINSTDNDKVDLTMADKATEAAKADEPFTAPIVVKVDENPADAFNRFSQPIVALIGPFCVSACDLFAGMLKQSGRAVLVGQPTMGTGLGYTVLDNPTHTYHDRFNLLSVQIPIFMFGILPADVDESKLTYQDAMKYSLENKPTLPDIPYEYTGQDLQYGGIGLIETIAHALEPKR